MATKAENERLAVLETKMATVETAVNKLDTSVQNLPDELIKKLDERYVKKSEFRPIAETVEPLTKLRKRLWALVLSSAVIMTVVFELAKDKFLKG